LSDPIGPGDQVEFYRGFKGRPVPDWSPITLGGIYRVSRLVDTTDDDGETPIPGCQLAEVAAHIPGLENLPQGWGFPLECFRPVRKPKRDVLLDLKAYFGFSRVRERA
jgi:hypothetical protein